MYKNKKVIILGGGSAGWITALYARKILPTDIEITVIESSKIGILGAGEGTTPHFMELMYFLEIPLSELSYKAKATIKNGIKFTNWNSDNDFYYHSFSAMPGLDGLSCNKDIYSSDSMLGMYHSIIAEKDLKKFDLLGKLSEEYKVPIIPRQKQNGAEMDAFGNFALHFDARLIAETLKEIGVLRGIKLIETEIADYIFDNNKNLIEVVSINNEKIGGNFFIDCSGFAREIIGKRYESKWVSVQNYLISNAAIPFFPEIDDNIPPYTEAIAMPHGWIWKIPLQHRYGCGYIFNDNISNPDIIKKEISNKFNIPIERLERIIKFQAGYYEKAWINNVVSIGLSSAFLEPLEATSIWLTIEDLRDIFVNYKFMFDINEKIINRFNKNHIHRISEYLDMIYIHYMTNKKDNEFWNHFSLENAPKGVKDKIEAFTTRMVSVNDKINGLYSLESWISVLNGINILNKDVAKNVYMPYGNKKSVDEMLSHKYFQNSDFLKEAVSHKDLLRILNRNYEKSRQR